MSEVEMVRKENLKAKVIGNELQNRTFENIVLEAYAKYADKINNSSKIIGAHNGYPIISFELSFSDILKNYRIYGLYFKKKHSNSFFRMIFTCGGACALKLNDGIVYKGIKYDTVYAIIINTDKNKLVKKTLDFIKAHEMAHIINDNCESDYVWKGDEEIIADHFAKRKGYRVGNNVLDMTRWQVYSYHYIETSKNFLFGIAYLIMGFTKHFALNVVRKYRI